ncbi:MULTISPECIES: DNA cytosine methyltransferase [Burkholderia cepacia complex]|uniref:DNA cytosine methyltransferase n=1 Tax=Burkholderia cepacia complex TaxID=87882 RepID=UPI0023DDB242|nr:MULTISPECIES: DNA cytosine methyltransferase [Burkholderia cepacia complex]MDF3089931.1 DNA cytosine methyltransferase [Burkholderia semiarida]MDF3103454.1 DNA cytosine methyltransferase [Burkholderia semiarida]WJN76500.1 DNA-cytosine methyltransferase [Burkholderia anthina]
MPIPIIDLFAGPGGLGEGFASVKGRGGKAFFKIGLSIEKNPVAHRTLTLRAVFRHLRGTKDVRHYYRYVRGEINEATFRRIPSVASAFAEAEAEARCLELGKSDESGIDSEIRAALKGQEIWVLIGGPPCQAYSLAGRSRRANDKTFHKDEKHFLYKEYLRIIRVHKPTIFVMENVKGLLSSQHSGDPMFEKIITDLSMPADGLEYEIRSFVKGGSDDGLQPIDYVIHAERYGIPQSRHRVILLGVRKDAGLPKHELLTPAPKPITVRQTIDDLPRIRSRLSRGDSLEAWRTAVQAAPSYVKGWRTGDEASMIETMRSFAGAATSTSTGGPFFAKNFKRPKKSTELQRWLHDRSLGGVCQHEARSHMASDLARYLFSACFAHSAGYFPQLNVFPPKLLPAHVNVHVEGGAEAIPFKDRFRVQCRNKPATTVVAHIAKDGHYYIHYDPAQCRSLTVREAARLQTFPDNYFFEGNRTEQYTQVGNAVPPLLAHKLAKIVRNLLNQMNRKNRKKTVDSSQNESTITESHLTAKQLLLLAEAD